MKIKTLKSKFILAYVISLSIVLAVTVIVFGVGFRLSVNKYIKKNIFAMQNTLDESVTEVINESAYLYGRVMRSENVYLLREITDLSLTQTQREEAFNSLFARAGVREDFFSDVVLITEGMRFSLNGELGVDESDAAFLKDRNNSMSFLGNVKNNLVLGIYSENVITEFSGTFLFYMKEAGVAEMCSFSKDGYSFIMRSDGLVISHPESSLVGKSIIYSDTYNIDNAPEYKTAYIDGEKRIVAIGSAGVLNSRYGFNSYIISVLDYKFYFSGVDATLAILICVSFGIFALAVIIAVIRARHISEPITALSGKINAMNEPTKEHKSVLTVDDELVQLERNYDAMMDRIFDLVEKNKEDAQLQRKLELDSLQMQINPHFLYNTLDAISWMAKIKKQPEIEQLVMNLAKFFRLSLHNGDKFVTVAEDVALVESYLVINEIRFPDKVHTHIEVEEQVADLKILKLILQPLVENCVKYAYVEKGGNLWIRAYGKQDDIILEVEDDGAGFDVPEDILTRPPKKDSGYGLKNVNERIRLQYGEEYGLTVQSEIGKGTKFTLKLKKITE